MVKKIDVSFENTTALAAAPDLVLLVAATAPTSTLVSGAAVVTIDAGAAGSEIVSVPTTKPLCPSLTTVPPIVSAGPPGDSVVPSMITKSAPLGTMTV